MAQGFRLDISVYLDRSLVHGNDLDTLQDLLIARAPGWSQGLQVWRNYEAKIPIDVKTPGELARTLRSLAEAATAVNIRYWQTNEPPAGLRPERVMGSEELRGANPSLILIIDLDDVVFRPIGNTWIWGNSIAIQICRARVEGASAPQWAHDLFVALCGALSPVHAKACMSGEYATKNISHEGGGTRAIGIDRSSSLPGLYWLNFVGRSYRDFIGLDKLSTAPAFEAREIGDGVLIGLADDPRSWSTPEYQRRERAVLDHIGTEYFFDRSQPDRRTTAPPFKFSR
ncbi:MAG: hypothetical protein U0893_15460 [Chloroflexota bacterium]